MLLSFFWFLAGALCSLALLRVNTRQLRLQRPLLGARRARRERGSTIDAMPPLALPYAGDAGHADDDFDIEREIDRLTGRVQSLYSQEMLDRARHALRPGLAGLGIQIRTRK